MHDIADLESQEDNPRTFASATSARLSSVVSNSIPVKTGDDLVERKRGGMGPVLSPDRPACMLPTGWAVVRSVECV